MGLISEILCKHTYQGKPLPTNIVFFAACNPYRVNKIDKNNFKLIYDVNPLPPSLLNFVIDFGIISQEDEKKYIINIIEKSQKEFFNKYKSNNYKENDFVKIYELAVNMIVESQKYIRNRNEVSSVSLREIKRFNIFFEFFYDYIMKKKDFDFNQKNISYSEKDYYKFYSKITYKDIHIYSIILSIFVCYYLRIPDNNNRKELDNILRNILEKYDRNYSDFLKIPLIEEKFIVESIDLEKGIAINKALLDSIFALFVAINTKVPIFIVGKPGCGKSLSVQLIYKSMRGKDSKKLFFKNLPEIIMHCYQGSIGSSSKGVKKVFKKARNLLRNINKQKEKNNEVQNIMIVEENNNQKREIISMIYFDMMSLAEHSLNNPLKVIHSELEYDINEDGKKVAFVGISNSALDASIMNSGLFLSIPDPERGDVKFTSYIIGESYDLIFANIDGVNKKVKFKI